jgi:hypothetical protein
VADHWEPGQLIVRREILGLAPGFHPEPRPDWYGRPWEGVPVHVVEDTAEQLVTYLPPGAELGFVDGEWPTADGRHPWSGRSRWTGHGCLMVQRPGDAHAVWHFWTGPDRDFACWYINLQADFVRTELGYDTQDYELDLVVSPDGTYEVKDLEVLDDRVVEGRFTADLVAWIRELGSELCRELDQGRRWWDPVWSGWTPPEGWVDARLPEGWATAG